jgi:aminopeptidase N
MIRNFLGSRTFTKGIRYYLTSNSQGVVSSDDLYASLQQAMDEDWLNNNFNVKESMETWENHSGYPMVTLNRIGNEVRVTQEKFSYSNEASNHFWWIPIDFVTPSNSDFAVTKHSTWISGERQARVISGVTSGASQEHDWVIVNNRANGFYRVNYDTESWNRIIRLLKSANYRDINSMNRAQLIDDSLSMAKVGKTSYAIPLEMLEYLSRETEYIPWAAVS